MSPGGGSGGQLDEHQADHVKSGLRRKASTTPFKGAAARNTRAKSEGPVTKGGVQTHLTLSSLATLGRPPSGSPPANRGEDDVASVASSVAKDQFSHLDKNERPLYRYPLPDALRGHNTKNGLTQLEKAVKVAQTERSPHLSSLQAHLERYTAGTRLLIFQMVEETMDTLFGFHKRVVEITKNIPEYNYAHLCARHGLEVTPFMNSRWDKEVFFSRTCPYTSGPRAAYNVRNAVMHCEYFSDESLQDGICLRTVELVHALYIFKPLIEEGEKKKGLLRQIALDIEEHYEKLPEAYNTTKVLTQARCILQLVGHTPGEGRCSIDDVEAAKKDADLMAALSDNVYFAGLVDQSVWLNAGEEEHWPEIQAAHAKLKSWTPEDSAWIGDGEDGIPKAIDTCLEKLPIWRQGVRETCCSVTIEVELSRIFKIVSNEFEAEISVQKHERALKLLERLRLANSLWSDPNFAGALIKLHNYEQQKKSRESIKDFTEKMTVIKDTPDNEELSEEFLDGAATTLPQQAQTRYYVKGEAVATVLDGWGALATRLVKAFPKQSAVAESICDKISAQVDFDKGEEMHVEETARKLDFAKKRSQAVTDLQALRASVNEYEALGDGPQQRFQADCKDAGILRVVELNDKYNAMEGETKDLIQNTSAVLTILSHAQQYISNHSDIAVVKRQEPLQEQLDGLEIIAKGAQDAETSWGVNVPPGSNFKNFLAKTSETLDVINAAELLSRTIATQKARSSSQHSRYCQINECFDFGNIGVT